ncbi:MAG: hypothetical protein JSS89_01600 [Bacteroidetes bacterium]|nr:hypothetical protein [Bacteroidota bacterium]
MKHRFIAWNFVVVMTVILCVVSCKEERPFGITFTTTYVLRDTNAYEISYEREHIKDHKPGLWLGCWRPKYAEAIVFAPQLETLIKTYVLEHGMLPPSTNVFHMGQDYLKGRSVGDTVFGQVLSKDQLACYDDTIMHNDEQHHCVADSVQKSEPVFSSYRTMVVPFKRGWIYRLYWIGENHLDEQLKGDDVLLLEGILKERQ